MESPIYFQVKQEAWDKAKQHGMYALIDIPIVGEAFEVHPNGERFRFSHFLWSWRFTDCNKVTEEVYKQYREKIKVKYGNNKNRS